MSAIAVQLQASLDFVLADIKELTARYEREAAELKRIRDEFEKEIKEIEG